MAKNRTFDPYQEGTSRRAQQTGRQDPDNQGKPPRITGAMRYFLIRRQQPADAVVEELEEQSPIQPPANGDAGQGGDGAAPAVDAPVSASPFTRFFGWVVSITFAIVAIWAAVAALTSGDPDVASRGFWWARAFAFAIIGLGLLVLQGLGGQYGILRPIVGADGRFSTSLTQLALWTLAVTTAFAWLVGRVLFANGNLDTLLPADVWDDYVLLLGGPFAAAVLAKGVVTYKLQAGTLQKSEPTTTSASQIIEGDDGETDLVDSQYLLFNAVALGYFLVEVISSGALPRIPGPLLAMTGSTAALYVANKAAHKNAPTVTSVTPRSVLPGTVVTVFGTNFDPGDKADTRRRITVSVTGVEHTIYSSDNSDTYVRFRMPLSVESGEQAVTVTSTAGVETAPTFIEVETAP